MIDCWIGPELTLAPYWQRVGTALEMDWQLTGTGLAMDWRTVGIILMMDWHLIVRGLTLWGHLTVVWKWCRPESSWLRIVLVPLTKWGFVTRIGLVLARPLPIECQWGWFEMALFMQLGELLAQDWHWIGQLVRKLAYDWRIGHGLTLDWWIGHGLTSDWRIGHGFTLDWRIGHGLSLDWQIGHGLTLHWQIGNGLADWHGICRGLA